MFVETVKSTMFVETVKSTMFVETVKSTMFVETVKSTTHNYVATYSGINLFCFCVLFPNIKKVFLVINISVVLSILQSYNLWFHER